MEQYSCTCRPPGLVHSSTSRSISCRRRRSTVVSACVVFFCTTTSASFIAVPTLTSSPRITAGLNGPGLARSYTYSGESNDLAMKGSATQQHVDKPPDGLDRHIDTKTTHYHDSPFLHRSDGINDENCERSSAPVDLSALIILNSPINNPPSRIFQYLWEKSSYRICADGGANRLYHATVDATGQQQQQKYVPDLIKGDLDSLRPDVQSYYEQLGTDVERDPDQDTNDLDKALQSVLSYRESEVQMNVYVYGAFGGRFDQEMASIQALYRWADEFQNRLVLYSDETCSFLLPAGVTNEVRLPAICENDENSQGLIGEGATCGLIPLGCRCEFVRTTGLKWNLDGTTALEFGGLVSTSNRIMDNVVTVQSSHPLVFSAEVIGGLD